MKSCRKRSGFAPGRLQGRFADFFDWESSIFNRVLRVFYVSRRFCEAFFRRKTVKIDQNQPCFKSCRKWSGFAPGRLQGRFADCFDSESSIFTRVLRIFYVTGRFCEAFFRRKTVKLTKIDPVSKVAGNGQDSPLVGSRGVLRIVSTRNHRF